MRLVTSGPTFHNLGTVLYLNARDVTKRYSGPLPESFSVISHVGGTAAPGVRLRSYFLDGGRNVKGVPCFVYHVCRNRITDDLDELKGWLRLNGYSEPEPMDDSRTWTRTYRYGEADRQAELPPGY